jgi:hypothetical protein
MFAAGGDRSTNCLQKAMESIQEMVLQDFDNIRFDFSKSSFGDLPDSGSTYPYAQLSSNACDSPALANENTAFKVLGAIGFSHFLNDMIQSLLPAIYPLLKSSFSLSFTQIGLITLTFQITASLLQPTSSA